MRGEWSRSPFQRSSPSLPRAFLWSTLPFEWTRAHCLFLASAVDRDIALEDAVAAQPSDFVVDGEDMNTITLSNLLILGTPLSRSPGSTRMISATPARPNRVAE